MKSLNFSFKSLFAILFVTFFNYSCSSDENTTMEEPIVQEEVEADGGDTTTEDDDVDDTEAIFLTDNLIVDASKAFVNYTLPAVDYQKYINEEGDVRDITKEIYNHFNDDYDLIVILAVETLKPEGTAYGITTPAKNSIQGLGGSVFDATSSFGSDGRLNGVVFMPRTEFVQSGPFLHEIAHLWANKGFIGTTVGGHWGYASTGGQLGGFDTLEDLGSNTYKGTVAGRTSFGTFANGGNSIPYSNVELYVMGLIPESELAAIQVAINPVAGNGAGEFTADEIKTYTAQELIAANGKRIPSYEVAQKEFTALTVIISPENAIEDTKKEAIVTSLEDFFKQGPSSESTYNFWTATGERAHFSNGINASSIQ
ncbi:hypothetical protein [Cellulophaga baltica]|uniref:hypothetical protein n=1 Tax=Cellulophaga baltica TaxID=76594 RepID=UPI000413D2B9